MIALNQPHHFHSFSHDGFRSGALGPARHGGGVLVGSRRGYFWEKLSTSVHCCGGCGMWCLQLRQPTKVYETESWHTEDGRAESWKEAGPWWHHKATKLTKNLSFPGNFFTQNFFFPSVFFFSFVCLSLFWYLQPQAFSLINLPNIIFYNSPFLLLKSCSGLAHTFTFYTLSPQFLVLSCKFFLEFSPGAALWPLHFVTPPSLPQSQQPRGPQL